MEDQDSLLLKEYHPTNRLARLVDAVYHSKPRWMGPTFVVTLLFGIAAIVVIIVLASLLANADSDDNTPFGPAKAVCGTTIETLDTAWKIKLHKETRQRLLQTLFENVTLHSGIIYMVGGSIPSRYDTDVELPFRQESNFLYMTGVVDPDCSFIIDLKTQATILLVPRRTSFYAVWNGIPLTPEQIQQKYGMDSVVYGDQFNVVLANLTRDVVNTTSFTVYTLSGVSFPSNKSFTINTRELGSALKAAREIKTEAEIELMKVAIQVSSDAHTDMMKIVSNELYEYSVASSFISYSYECSLQFQSYSPIVGAGYHSAILHYTANDKLLSWKQDASDGRNNILLIDAGAEYYGYGADITRTYPISGKFSDPQRKIYNLVLDVQSGAIAELKAGVRWSHIERTTSLLTCNGLLANNLIVPTFNCSYGSSVMGEVVRVLLPHGVGHHLGLDVHDSYISPTVLEPGMVVTVEPGIYFNEVGLANAFANARVAQYLVQSEIQKYLDMEFGGVRIEDDLLITDTGAVMLSSAPRTIEDIERLMSSSH